MTDPAVDGSRLIGTVVSIETYTDPTCPWAWTTEAARLRLRWHYGDQLTWRRRYALISERRGEAEAGGFTPAVETDEDTAIARRWGTPLHLAPRGRITTSRLPCLVLIATRLHDDAAEEKLLRALWVRGRARGGMIDEPAVIVQAAEEVNLDGHQLLELAGRPEVEDTLRADMEAARDPDPVARHLAHKLGAAGTRYSTPTWIMRTDGRQAVLPGFQPLESCEAALANLAPDLVRRPPPASAQEILDWSDTPPSTAEVACLLGVEIGDAREQLCTSGARFDPAGSDGFWIPTQTGAATQ